MNSANDRYGSSLDRPLSPGKPVDPATRLSELLAQSLEELTRPFDPPRPDPQRSGPAPHPSRPAEPRDESSSQDPRHGPHHEQAAEPMPEPSSEQGRIDADKALAELEAELFAAAKQVDRDASISHHEDYDDEHAEDRPSAGPDKHLGEFERALLEPQPEPGEAAEKPQSLAADAMTPL